MNRKEREQAKVFEQVKQGVITQKEAAIRLRITERWVRSKIKRYLRFNDLGLVHRNRGKKSPRRWNQENAQLLIKLLQGEWHDFGPTFATEKLAEIHSIKVSREVVRQTMTREGLWMPKRQRNKHRKRRERKPMLGMMVQLDGSPHDWFEGRDERCTLLVFIDDATSRILWLEFATSESIESLMRATKNYIEKHGIPASFYTDHGGVFHVNLNNEEGDKKTQWERACGELNIVVHHAHSPQAKGRVERCNQTMQDRLVKELRLAGVSSIDVANQYLRTSGFMSEHNIAFAEKAAQKGNAHADHESYNLDDIFSVQESHMLMNDYTIKYQKRIFQLRAQQKTIIRPKDEIIVKTSLDGKIGLSIRKTELAFHEVKAKSCKEQELAQPKPRKVKNNSRRWVSGLAPITTQESWMKPASTAAESL